MLQRASALNDCVTAYKMGGIDEKSKSRQEERSTMESSNGLGRGAPWMVWQRMLTNDDTSDQFLDPWAAPLLAVNNRAKQLFEKAVHKMLRSPGGSDSRTCSLLDWAPVDEVSFKENGSFVRLRRRPRP